MQLIIDTDLGFDVDDVGAIAVAHALANQGTVDILGIVCNTGRDACIVGVDIINTYYGRSNMSIGSFKGSFGSYTDNGQDFHYVNDLRSRFPHRVNSRDDVPSALDVYKAALQGAADKSVTIASIGETTNLQDLLRDDIDLVRAWPGLKPRTSGPCPCLAAPLLLTHRRPRIDTCARRVEGEARRLHGRRLQLWLRRWFVRAE